MLVVGCVLLKAPASLQARALMFCAVFLRRQAIEVRNETQIARNITLKGGFAMLAKDSSAAKTEARILFQRYFKSVGPRTYAAQVKEASNGNHFLVLTEGKRDEATDQVRKTRLFVFSEDFQEFFDMVQQSARFIKDHPVPDDVKKRREKFWAKKTKESSRTAEAPRR